MFLKFLLDVLGSDNKKEQSTYPRKKSQSELKREKDRREYELWVMSEEDRYDDGDE